jgi:LemA protein
MKTAGIVLGVLILISILFAGWMMGYYNRFVNMDEGIKNAWAQVENQLMRRNDLIPNLVNTVKGYASHEKEVFTNIADARAKLGGAKSVSEKIDAANEMTSALSRLLVIVEQYPQLKADQSFNRLMDELAGTENRLAVERKRYNDQVGVQPVEAQNPVKYHCRSFWICRGGILQSARGGKGSTKGRFRDEVSCDFMFKYCY